MSRSLSKRASSPPSSTLHHAKLGTVPVPELCVSTSSEYHSLVRAESAPGMARWDIPSYDSLGSPPEAMRLRSYDHTGPGFKDSFSSWSDASGSLEEDGGSGRSTPRELQSVQLDTTDAPVQIETVR